ncbi:hypothetical protein [Nostoc sp.]
MEYFKWGVGSREWENEGVREGVGEELIANAQCPMPHAQCPIP